MSEYNNQDILEELLFQSEGNPVVGQYELDQLLHSQPMAGITGETEVQPSPLKKSAKESKKKSTHYISNEVFEELGEAKTLIPNFLPEGLNLRVTKSRIVDSALKMLLRELEEKGETSILVRLLLKSVDG